MKEMLQSKVLMGFIVFVLGFTYWNAIQTKNFEEPIDTNNLIVMNG